MPERLEPSQNVCPLFQKTCLSYHCAWFYNYPEKPAQAGECSIHHLTVLLKALNENVSGIAARA